jgi:hypothetical protein
MPPAAELRDFNHRDGSERYQQRQHTVGSREGPDLENRLGTWNVMFGTVLEYEMTYFDELASYHTAVSRLEETTGTPIVH